MSGRRWRRATVWLAALWLIAATTGAAAASLYSLDEAIGKGVVSARISLYSTDDEQHALAGLSELNPGLVYGTYVGSFGVISQRDLDAAGRIGRDVRKLLPRSILGGGINESVTLSAPAQTLDCGGTLGTRTFPPAAMSLHGTKQLAGTAWLDLATPAARDYYLCVGTMLIDRGFTLIDFKEHGNVIAHASAKPAAIKTYVEIMTQLRRYGAAKGEQVYFSGDSTSDDTARLVDCVLVPSRFFHLTFAQKYQHRIARPGIGVGYAYSLSPLHVRDVMAGIRPGQRAFFYVDNWDAKQDDLRRFMELDAENRRFLIETSARTAHAGGAHFIPTLLHCIGCIPPEVVHDACEIRRNGKSEYDAVACGDLPAIRKALAAQR